MYFSRIRLRTDIDTGALARTLCKQDSYHEHQILWQLFDGDSTSKRDFLFRRDNLNGWPLFYLVSQRIPNLGTPAWHVDWQDYHPRLYTGQRLAFTLRANPVVTRKHLSGARKRHDVVMDLKKQRDWKTTHSSEREPLYELVQEAAETWLSPRLDQHGAKLETLCAEGYLQHKNHKRGQSGSIRYSTLDLSGTLTVIEPEAFVNTLYHGIGPAKAFGCGLLLVRRI
jgi:CRISPR system Cascade subunit CasE